MTEFGLTYFDIFAIILIAVFFIVGINRGFLRQVSSLITWVLSLIGSKVLSGSVEPKLFEYLKVENQLNLNIKQIVSNLDFSNSQSITSSLDETIGNLEIVGPFLNDIVKGNWNITEIVQRSSPEIQQELTNCIYEMVEPLAHNIVGIISFILVFIGLFIIFSIIASVVVKGLTSIKIVGGADKLLGGILGIVKGGLFLIIFYSVVFLVLSLTGSEYLQTFMGSRFFDIFIGIKDVIPKI